MASVREKAVDAVRALLATVTLDTRYPSGIGTDRVVGIQENPSSVPTPVILLMQGEEEVDNVVGDRYHCVVDVSIGFVDHVQTGDNPDKDATTFMSEIQSIIPIEFQITAPQYNGLNDNALQTVQMKEVGNTINVSAALNGMYLGQISYEMFYRRSIFTPNSF